MSRVQTWHATPDTERGPPEHAALAASTGAAKSTITLAELLHFITTMKALGLPHRVLWLIPYWRLGRDAEAAMRSLGLAVATWRGRDQFDPDRTQPDTHMCLDPDAVTSAIAIAADVEATVCGNPANDNCCPFHGSRAADTTGSARCSFQRQKAKVAAADVVIGAHNLMFARLPKVLEKDLALVIVDEAWWQIGLKPGLATKIPSFTDDLLGWYVLRDPDANFGIAGRKRRRPKGMPHRQVFNQSATSELHELAKKARHAFEATPIGEFVSRQAVEQTGLTADECARARQLEWQRQVEDALRPGMTSEARKKAIVAAAVNATLPRRTGIWSALEDLLTGTETHTGRLQHALQSDASGTSPVILLHQRTPICDAVLTRPILLLDATLPTQIVRYYLPRLNVLADLNVTTPHCGTFLITGGFGKTTLAPHPKAKPKENAHREARLAELRDFVALHSGGNALVITYKVIEPHFADLPGVRTAHFGALTGLDTFGDVRTLFLIGRPLPKPDQLREMALALTGRVIPNEASRIESRGQRMTDGSGLGVQIRAYANPDLEVLRTAITDAAVLQALGRGRAVNRTAATPLTSFIFADVVLPVPVKAIHGWSDIRPSPSQRMAARGLVLENPSDARRLHADLFPNASAAEKALQRERSQTFPYETSSIGKCLTPRLTEGRYRPQGQGHKNRRLWVADWRLPQVRADLEAALGPLALFELEGDQPTSQPASPPPPPPFSHPPTPPPPANLRTPQVMPRHDPTTVIAMSDQNKLLPRAPLQAGHQPSSPDAIAREIPGGYGELLPPEMLLRGYRITRPQPPVGNSIGKTSRPSA